MRLTKIKLAGFKSFVDPTTINFPADLTAIVGPNGCGKSNTIDAVRWVMGEGSAKHLRGDTMEDVIFNGSSARKPVAQASVELVFDNSDGSVGGEYAAYNEIALRRQVSRDGTSKYFLNNTRCRKRDITDIFLGTGLGPRSYAIIEQGMISRVVDAKPQELRVYIEEAAGISKYKERRRETENRIRHTRDNLDRLNDLREEIEKTINKLQRQSRAAERYTDLKTDERKTKAEVLGLKIRGLSNELCERQAALESEQTAVEKQLAEVRANEASTEELRQERNNKAEEMNSVQQSFYQIGSQITALEQSIKHQQELRQRQEQERAENTKLMQETREHIGADQQRLEQAAQELKHMQPAIDAATERKESADQSLAAVETRMKNWQQQWDAHNTRHAEVSREAQVEETTITQLERQISSLSAREKRLHAEQKEINTTELTSELDMFSDEVKNVQENVTLAQGRLDSISADIVSKRKDNTAFRQKIDQLQLEAHKIRAKISAIDALLQAALGKEKKTTQNWLAQQGLENATRMGELIDSEPKWSHAVEMVLGDYIEAVEVPSLEQHGAALRALEKGEILLFEKNTSISHQQPFGAQTLWSVVQAPDSVRHLLDSVLLADSFEQAIVMRQKMGEGQTVVTPEGMWFGKSWIRATREAEEHVGVLNRQQERDKLEQTLQDLVDRTAEQQRQYDRRRTEIQMLEEQRNEQQRNVSSVHELYAEKNALLSNRQSKREHVEGRQKNLMLEISELQQQLTREIETLELAGVKRSELLTSLEQLNNERTRLQQHQEQVTTELDQSRTNSGKQHDAMHEVQLKREKWLSVHQNMTESLERLRQQLDVQLSKEESLDAALSQDFEPDAEVQLKLQDLVNTRLVEEKRLEEIRIQVEQVDQKIKASDEKKVAIEEVLEKKREALQALKLGQQENKTRQQTFHEQLAETDFELESLLAELTEEANIGDWEEKAEKLTRRISRLGPINLAAIDEFKEQSERKEYLDSQYEDLCNALETLEGAIAKIDRETKARFKDTFDQVNKRLGEVFGKLFGGGTAHLEMTEDDLLTTGIAIMARPPGKRISNIHLMSGGEKAMTAVAMVFSIFELNPAPFCMLDEVDAPLDEANNARFCEMVREMSETVQFIVITHNKTTMEMTDTLMGVTMREPGVSRLVDVNVDEAVLMASA